MSILSFLYRKKVIKSVKDSDDKYYLNFSKDIIYIEDQFYPEMNDFILSNYDKITTLLAKKNKTFIFVPLQSHKFQSLTSYYYPSFSQEYLNSTFENIDYQRVYDLLIKLANMDITHICGFIEYLKENKDEIQLKYYPFFDEENSSFFWNQFNNYFFSVEYKNKETFTVNFSINKDYSEDKNEDLEKKVTENFADIEFPFQVYEIVYEIRERISSLQNMGVSHLIIKKLLSIDNEIKLSRITISKNYEILLPDYNNMEIEMSPLPKAVFFLFLRHPDGIMFKDLPDYKTELSDIYRIISNRENVDMVFQSIDDVTNPFKNSINEKCSRIREAFVSKFDDNIAKFYYVTGDRSTPKKIALDRSLVIWE